MIRIVASTILERPMLTRGNELPSKRSMVERHIRELPYMITSFHNAMVAVSRESKWCKLVFLRKRIPVELFSLIKTFLIRRGSKDVYPFVLCNHVPHRKYLLVESKLYRMELANDTTLARIREYICDSYEFRQETKGGFWPLRQFNILCRKLDFLEHVLLIRFLTTGERLVDTVYEIEHMLRYWF